LVNKSVIILIITIALFSSSAALSAPIISNLTGVIDNGESIVILGSEFGIKENPAPLRYDDFAGGTIGDSVQGWAHSTHQGRPPVYSDDMIRTDDNAVKCLFDNGQYLSSFGYRGDESLTKVYIDAWYLYSPADIPSRNHKIFRLYSGMTSGYPNLYFSHTCRADGGGTVSQDGVGHGNYVDYNGYGWEDADLTWIHIQGYFEESVIDADTGLAQLQINHQMITDEQSWRTKTSSNPESWHSVWFGNYLGHGSTDNCPSSPGASYTYWDDVYLDTTQARVEIGNAAVYTQCSHREIQIPSEWSADSVTISGHMGTFENGEAAYIFLIDEDGGVSEGFGPVVVGSEAVATFPGAPGQPLY
jgi:hypothetical protein